MNIPSLTYVLGDSVLHRLDARVKLVVLLAFSIGIFFVQNWWVLAVCAVCVAVCAMVARIPVRSLAVPLVPVVVLAAFAVAVPFVAAPGWDSLSSGMFVGVRMVVLVAASFVVCMTSSSTQLLDAFAFFVGPLRVLGVPVADISFTLALALRFIPVIAEELAWVRKAQQARGAGLAGLSFRRKLGIWGAAFSAVFVGLFHRADALADAMDVRCFGCDGVCGAEGRRR